LRGMPAGADPDPTWFRVATRPSRIETQRT
jgi:hypothetical protein